MNKPQQSKFLTLVQEHERAWGNDIYANRPDLATILSAPIVVFWAGFAPSSGSSMPPPRLATSSIPSGTSFRGGSPPPGTDQRLFITLHDNLNEIERYYVNLIMRLSFEPPRRRLVHLFVNQTEMRISEVKLSFEPSPPP
jgi:hypothetical protein